MFETFIKLILHIKEHRDLMHELWKKHPDLAARIENVVLHQDNAPYHSTRKTFLEVYVLWFQRAIHQPYSTDLAPSDIIYFLNLKSYLHVYQK